MQTEIEAKFLNINHEQIREKLKTLGAKQAHPMRLMRRINFDFDDLSLEKKSGWVRLRDEVDKVTLAYKRLNHRGLDGTKEVQVNVSDFDTTCQLLEQLGLKKQSYQETKRESWLFNDVEIELDEWPWIKPFIEIEAKNEKDLIKTVELMGLDMANAVHGSVEVAYQAEYDVTEAEIDHWDKITFDPLPKSLEEKRR